MFNDRQLLAQYVRDGSHDAFTALVSRYLNFVYSCALRQVRSREAAEDVSQIVFANLARKAAALPPGVVLAGWLHRDTRYTALDMLRAEQRRQHREQQALAVSSIQAQPEPDWEQIRPCLDEALDQMNPADRDALLLRFFEQRSLKEIGTALGSGEDAARKRVARALDRLREFLVSRGVTTSASALSLTLTTNGLQSTPAGLVGTIALSALAGAKLGSIGTGPGGLFKIMTMSPLKTTMFGLLAIAAITTAALQYSALQKLRAQNRSLEAQAQGVAGLRTENEALSNRLASAQRAPIASRETTELMRLRGEVARLRAALSSSTSMPAPRKENSTTSAAGSAQPSFTTTLNACVGDGQILVAGGWAVTPGNRTFILITPSISARDVGTGPSASEPSGPTLTMKTTTVVLPESSLAQFGLDQMRAEGQSSSAQAVLSPADVQALLTLVDAPPEGLEVTHGRITLRDGMQTELSMGGQSPAGEQPLLPHYTVGLMPHLSPDQKAVNLTLNAQVNPTNGKPERE